ncbi:MAG: hypothetical protein ABIP17_03915 [Ilumatobacteraceae bacterium]
MPYIVMYTEDCPGEFCDRIRPVLAEANVALAGLGSGGRYVVVDGAGHQTYFTHRDQILTEIDTMVG